MLSKGDKIGGYTLLEKVGSGGFGDVWKAEKRTALDVNYFALKFFRPKDDQLDLERIGKELAIWKQLRGLGNIISVIELDQFEDFIYVVSDFADGGSLESWLKAHDGKAPTEAEAVKITLEILTGLENLHDKGFVHRDLKPDNILIMNGKFCLADFGVSREVKTHSKSTGTAGTVEYMPPEAFEKNPPVTLQTDIWAIGVMLQRLLTGKLSFPYEMPALMLAILQDEPEPMPETVPKGLRQIIKKALQKKREDRFQTAREMYEALKNPAQFVNFVPERESSTIVDTNFDQTEVLESGSTPDWQAIEAEKQRQAEQERIRLEAEERQRQEIIELERARQWREMEAEKERQRLRDVEEAKRKEDVKRQEAAKNKQQEDKFNQIFDEMFGGKSQKDEGQAAHLRIDNPPDPSNGWKWLLTLGVAGFLFIGIPMGIFIFNPKPSGSKNTNQANNAGNFSNNRGGSTTNIPNKRLINSATNNTTVASNTVSTAANLGSKIANTVSNTSIKTAEEYFYLGMNCELEKDNECAFSNYSKAIELKSNFGRAYAGRGLAYFYRGDYDQAIKDYTRAIDLEPSYSMAYNNRGVAYDRKGNDLQAISDYQKAIQLDPNNQLAKDNLEKALQVNK